MNTKCSPEKVPDKLKGFYEYIGNPETADKVGFIKELGIEQGLEQGHMEASVTHALAMKKEGIAVELVSRVTGLTIEEIEKLS